ncbi:hypothetical protein [Burkholderia contaminans]|uniref:hypothetical protein n=1 Tax=Burkholderia contaminans TaxID=488447 RepID=UPI003D67E01B
MSDHAIRRSIIGKNGRIFARIRASWRCRNTDAARHLLAEIGAESNRMEIALKSISEMKRDGDSKTTAAAAAVSVYR